MVKTCEFKVNNRLDSQRNFLWLPMMISNGFFGDSINIKKMLIRPRYKLGFLQIFSKTLTTNCNKLATSCYQTLLRF